jgi:hypothetical protein
MNQRYGERRNFSFPFVSLRPEFEFFDGVNFLDLLRSGESSTDF